ncbi:CapA family protein, partial [Escherichia coli]
MQNNKIIIGGDVSFDQVKVDEYALSGLSKLSSFLGEAEYSIVNLECPITNSREKINKIGPNIKCGTNDGTKLLSALNLTHVTLANNHIMDYGYEGLK